MNKKYRLVYGHCNSVYDHEDFNTWEEREIWSHGFSRGAQQYAGEEAFTMNVPEDLNPMDEEDDYFLIYKDRLSNVSHYLNMLDAKDAYEGR